MINLFCGYDPREAVGFHVFVHSVLKHASVPVNIIALDNRGLPQGSNCFTLSRFLVPYLMGFSGHAIFADASDMLCQSDIAELDSLFDSKYAVQVVKHADYTTRHPVKYIGTELECKNRDYTRKNWASLMLINCEHRNWRDMTPDLISRSMPLSLLQLNWAQVGELPPWWNVLADEGHDTDNAAILHWTAGIPAFTHYHDAPCADAWHDSLAEMMAV